MEILPWKKPMIDPPNDCLRNENRQLFVYTYLVQVFEQAGNRLGFPIPLHGIHSPNNRVVDEN